MQSQTPGWQTTEFWLTAAGSLIAVLVAIGVIKPADKDALNNALVQAVNTAFGFLAAAAMIWKYTHARGEVKKAQQSTQPATWRKT